MPNIVQYPFASIVSALDNIEALASNRNRGDSAVIEAQSDLDVIKLWLAEKAANSMNTALSYRTEVERFLLWTVTLKAKTLSDLTRNDMLEFEHFLRSIPSDWINPTRHARSHPSWKPFVKQLSPTSIKHALAVTHSLLAFMVKIGWLKANPMPLMRNKSANWSPSSKSLSRELANCLLDSCSIQCGETLKAKEIAYKARDKWIVAFLLGMAARASETISSMASIEHTLIGGESCWVWHVIGKGQKAASIPMPDWVVEEMTTFRTTLRVSPFPIYGDTLPIFPSLQTMTLNGEFITPPKPLTRNSLYKRLTQVILPRAKQFAQQHNIAASDLYKLDLASVHWLRHTSLRELADDTKDMRLVMEKGRHANISTSAGYVKTGLVELRNATRERKK